MSRLFSLTVPGIICLISCYGMYKGVDIYSAAVSGAREGLQISLGILAPLICLLGAVYMLRASGVLDAIAGLIAPVMEFIGIPVETVSLMLLRPFSGSGALAVGGEIMSTYSPDSLIGRTAAVMLGSTETTFYVISVYFGAAGIKDTRHAIPAAVAADIAGFLTASLTARLFWG